MIKFVSRADKIHVMLNKILWFSVNTVPQYNPYQTWWYGPYVLQVWKWYDVDYGPYMGSIWL